MTCLSTAYLHGRAACDLVSSSGCEQQMVMESTDIDRGVLHFVLTDVPDVVGVRVGLPVGISDHRFVFIMLC